MSQLSILTYPNSVLRRQCTPVENLDGRVLELVQDMSKLMLSAQGIGLAAPQVGVSRRVITINIGEGLIALVNPAILERQGRASTEEGCLSCPGISVEVARSERVQVKGLDLQGKEVTIEAEGLLARVLQHEIDHLNGILILDKLPWLEKMMAKQRLRGQ